MEQLVYISTATITGLAEIRAILRDSVRNNQRDGISGLLWWHGSFFIQVLEGSSDKLDALLVRLRRDKRHTDLKVIHRGAITTRQFGSWGMALVTDPLELDQFIDRHFDGILPSPADMEADQITDMLRDLVTRHPPNMARLLQTGPGGL